MPGNISEFWGDPTQYVDITSYSDAALEQLRALTTRSATERAERAAASKKVKAYKWSDEDRRQAFMLELRRYLMTYFKHMQVEQVSDAKMTTMSTEAFWVRPPRRRYNYETRQNNIQDERVIMVYSNPVLLMSHEPETAVIVDIAFKHEPELLAEVKKFFKRFLPGVKLKHDTNQNSPEGFALGYTEFKSSGLTGAARPLLTLDEPEDGPGWVVERGGGGIMSLTDDMPF